MAGRVQVQSGAVQSGTSLAVTLVSPTTVGNTVVVCIGSFFAFTPSSVVDNKGNTYVQDFADTNTNILIYRAPITTAGASHQITVTVGSAAFYIVTVMEVSGPVTASSPLDQSNQQSPATGGGSTYSSGIVLTTVAAEYLLGVFHTGNDATNATPDAPWVTADLASDGSFHRLLTQDEVVSATGFYNATGVFGAGSGWDSGAIATLILQSTTTQIAAPISDLASGTWTPSVGIHLFATIDEQPTPDDSDYDRSGATPVADIMQVGLTSLSTPTAGTQTLRIRGRTP